MTVAAISMVKDEADVIEGTLRHLADEVDWVLVADNGSTDGTREILDELANELPLEVVDDPERGYFQSQKMSALATMANDAGADWIVPFDADELWVYEGDRISVELGQSTANVVTAALYNYFPSAIDPEGEPFRSIQWRQRQSAPLPKVAFRYRPGAVVHQGNHGVTLAGDTTITGGLRISHFPYRSPEQFTRKALNGAAAYKATDLPGDVGAHWRGYGEIHDRFGDEGLHSVFREHFWALSPADKGWVLDPAPYMRWASQ